MHVDRHTGTTITELEILAAEVEARQGQYSQALMQSTQREMEELTRSGACQIPVAKETDIPHRYTTSPCGIEASWRCSDCKIPICEYHGELHPDASRRSILCPVCASMLRR